MDAGTRYLRDGGSGSLYRTKSHRGDKRRLSDVREAFESHSRTGGRLLIMKRWTFARSERCRSGPPCACQWQKPLLKPSVLQLQLQSLNVAKPDASRRFSRACNEQTNISYTAHASPHVALWLLVPSRVQGPSEQSSAIIHLTRKRHYIIRQWFESCVACYSRMHPQQPHRPIHTAPDSSPARLNRSSEHWNRIRAWHQPTNTQLICSDLSWTKSVRTLSLVLRSEPPTSMHLDPTSPSIVVPRGRSLKASHVAPSSCQSSRMRSHPRRL